jgi:ribonuclease VapC
MFIDASALCGIITNEPDAGELFQRLIEADQRITSPLAFWEASVAVSRQLGIEPNVAEATVTEFMATTGIILLNVPSSVGSLALDAHHRYGKGRHPAALNFGDCFAYACAKHYQMPLLYKGNDFGQTDIETA